MSTGPILLDLRDGPMVIEVPKGPLICAAFDLNQRWVADMGVPGPDAGKGGKHLLLPPDWGGQVPDGYFVARSTTYRVLAGVRSLPVGGDVQAANDRILTLKVHPLDPPAGWTEPRWLDLNGQPQDTTPVGWETTLEYWRALHEVIDTEPHLTGFGPLYGGLAALGIAKGRPFAPRRADDPDPGAGGTDRQRPATGPVLRRPPPRPGRLARPPMAVGGPAVRERRLLRRRPPRRRRPREVVLPGHRRLTGHVPPRRRRGIAVLAGPARRRRHLPRWCQDLQAVGPAAGANAAGELWFGPQAPQGAEDRWVKTISGRGWFVYFRIYGPEQPAFDGSWQLPDFQAVD